MCTPWRLDDLLAVPRARDAVAADSASTGESDAASPPDDRTRAGLRHDAPEVLQPAGF